MGCECCKPRPEEVPPSLPSKSNKTSRLSAQGKQLLQDFQALCNNIKAPKGVGPNPQALWTSADFKAYGKFLAALGKQAENLEQSPAIQMLGLPIEGLEETEANERRKVMESFVAELRGLHEPGELPDPEWLGAVKQLVSKKAVFSACKKRYEQLAKQRQDYQAATEKATEQEDFVPVDQVLALQTEAGETLDGYLGVIQQTERIFQAISFLSRVALGMQARVEALSGQAAPSTTDSQEIAPHSSGLEMEMLDREQVEGVTD
jgi:hypothetical protein